MYKPSYQDLFCTDANLAYVKHFGKKTEAVSATFKSLNSQGFNVAYKTADGAEHEVFIEYNAPVTKREDVRPVLEEMAKEAETALGMVYIYIFWLTTNGINNDI